ncbi:MAG TPA: hypothetical protein VGO58_01485 [Chitinophagaceae bacterium]|jgi:hypothetical protein|nr:hypothetical protein [Chitinophagaceae bacterium]
MNRKILTIILAIAIIAGFFLPLSNAGSTSAFDAVQAAYPVSGVEAILMKYLWILVPVSGLLLLIGALNNEQYAPARVLWAVLPLLALAYIIVRPVIEGMDIGAMVKSFGIGFWVMLGGALILAIYHPGKAKA